MLLAICMTGFSLAQPYFIKILIDEGLLAGNMNIVILFAVLIIVMAMVVFGIGGLNRGLYTGLSSRILFRLREDVYGRLMKLSPEFFGRWRTDDLVSRLDGDVAEVQRFSTKRILAAVNGLLALLGSLVIMVVLSWQLTLIAVALLLLQGVFLRRIRANVNESRRSLREEVSKARNFFIETLSSVKFIQSLSGGADEEKRLSEFNKTYLDEVQKLQVIRHMAGGIPGLLTTGAASLVFIAGGYLVTEGTITIGTLAAFAVYMVWQAGLLQMFLGFYTAYRRAMVSLVRVRELRRQKINIHDPEKPVLIGAGIRGDIKLDQVSFFYDDDEARGLRDISLHIAPGEKILITGPSGSGKSTLINLLHRHYDPKYGGIFMDGVRYIDMSLKELRGIIALVDQNTLLFHGTVKENMTYGAAAATMEEVVVAARAVHIDDFIQSLPEGYDTHIGERGVSLSGGQRQRLSLARALLMNPQMLILDEATSVVDPETEAEFQELLDHFFEDRTRIIICRDAGSIANLDRIFSLQDGRLTEVTS